MTVRKETRGGRTRLVLDIQYRDANGKKSRYRRDAQVQTRRAAEAEERRLLVNIAQYGAPSVADDTHFAPLCMPLVQNRLQLQAEFLLAHAMVRMMQLRLKSLLLGLRHIRRSHHDMMMKLCLQCLLLRLHHMRRSHHDMMRLLYPLSLWRR